MLAQLTLLTWLTGSAVQRSFRVAVNTVKEVRLTGGLLSDSFLLLSALYVSTDLIYDSQKIDHLLNPFGGSALSGQPVTGKVPSLSKAQPLPQDQLTKHFFKNTTFANGIQKILKHEPKIGNILNKIQTLVMKKLA